MSSKNIPEWFELLNDEYEDYMNTLEELGRVVRQTGPIDEKTSHLIQLAAAAAINSEGAVHSHARRAQQAGATVEEINHTIILLTSTIGFPRVSAALSWAQDLQKKCK